MPYLLRRPRPRQLSASICAALLLPCLPVAARTLVNESVTLSPADPVEAWGLTERSQLTLQPGAGTLAIQVFAGSSLSANGATISATGTALSTLTATGRQTGSNVDLVGTTVRGARAAMFGGNFTVTASGTRFESTGGATAGIDLFNAGVTLSNSSSVTGAYGIRIQRDLRGVIGTTSRNLTVDGSTVTGLNSGIRVDSPLDSQPGVTDAVISLRNGTTVAGGNGIAIELAANTVADVEVDRSTLAGGLRVADGGFARLRLGNGSTMTGAMNGAIAATIDSSTWNVNGNSDVDSLAFNGGTIAFEAPSGGNYKTLTVRGDFSGNGGTLRMNTELGGDRSGTDKLHVQGSTSGQAFVQVNNVGGLGAQTVDGIQLVQVDGASNGEFNLSGRAVAGAYEYFLHKGGRADPDDGDWYLRSELPIQPPDPGTDPGPGTIAPLTSVMRPEVGAYLGNQAAATSMFMHTLHDRLGEPGVAEDLKPKNGDDLHSGWARVSGSRTDSRVGDGQLSVKTDSSLLQVGADLARWGEHGRGQFGVMASIGRATIDSVSDLTGYSAKGKVDGNAVGIYGTWYARPADRTGLYVDGWLQYGRYTNTVQGNALADERYSASSWQASAEAGYAWKVHEDQGSSFYVEPQAQVVFTNFRSDAHREFNGTVVDPQASSVTSRLGVRMYGHLTMGGGKQVQPFVTVNWWRRSKDNSMSFDGVQFAGGVPQDRLEIKAGAQLQMGGGWTGWGQLGLQTGKSGYRSVGAQVGAKYNW